MTGSRLALIIILLFLMALLGWYWYAPHDSDTTAVDDTISDSLNSDIVNGGDGNDILDVPDPDGRLNITPTSMGFSYDHNNPICPSLIGTVQFSGAPPDSTWQIGFDDVEQPIWFDVPGGLSGPIDELPVFEFPCLLDIYDSQSQFLDVTVEVLDTDSVLLGQQIINIFGDFEFNNDQI